MFQLARQVLRAQIRAAEEEKHKARNVGTVVVAGTGFFFQQLMLLILQVLILMLFRMVDNESMVSCCWYHGLVNYESIMNGQTFVQVIINNDG